MFKFEFLHSGAGDNEQRIEPADDSNAMTWQACQEITPTDHQIKHANDNIKRADMFCCGSVEIGHIYPEDVITELALTKSDIACAESNHSDLVASKYEGGLKIWECTYDLAEYLVGPSGIDFNPMGSLVLDLGCGAGILGLLALKKEATVHFQDYNSEVLCNVTIPNVMLNLPDDYVNDREEINKRCRFYSGDWKSFQDLRLSQNMEKYDFILTSETIYNSDNHQKIYSILKTLLKRSGIAYLAAKTYYFGVGGGIRQFEKLLREDGILQSDICWHCKQGVQREILQITFKTNQDIEDPA